MKFAFLLIAVLVIPFALRADGTPSHFQVHPTANHDLLPPEHKTLIYFWPSNPKYPVVKYLGFFTVLEKGAHFIYFCNTLHPNERFYLSGSYAAQPVYPQNIHQN